MDAKIPASEWSDPDLDNATPEVHLTLLWAKTNPDRNNCGAYRFSATRFKIETKGLDPSWHQRTMELLPDRFVRDGYWVLYVPFIRECLLLGTIVGEKGGINKGAQALTTPFQALPKPLQQILRTTYPELSVVWPKPLASPSEALGKGIASPSEALPGVEALVSPSGVGNQSLPTLERSETAAAPEGLGKGLARGCQAPEQSRAEQSRAEEGIQGEGTGGALVPTEAEVIEFARTFADAARGWAGIPEDYVLDWFSWRCTPKAGAFPRDWRGDLRRRFTAAVVRKETAPTNLGTVKTADPSRRLHELRARLEKGGLSPEERAAIREEIRKLENP